MWGLCVLGAGPKMQTTAGAGERKTFILYYDKGPMCFLASQKGQPARNSNHRRFFFLCVKKELVNLETQHFLDKKHL